VGQHRIVDQQPVDEPPWSTLSLTVGRTGRVRVQAPGQLGDGVQAAAADALLVLLVPQR
jgi:hypothetical protein